MHDFKVQPVETLLESLTGKTLKQLAIEELERQGLSVSLEDVVVANDPYYWKEVKATKVKLSDGREFKPKLQDTVKTSVRTDYVFGYEIDSDFIY